LQIFRDYKSIFKGFNVWDCKKTAPFFGKFKKFIEFCTFFKKEKNPILTNNSQNLVAIN